jgi:hypothetical protein
MSFLGFGKAKVAPTLTIGLPVSRDVTITAHIWPSDRPSCKDLRIAFYSKHPVLLESDVVFKILKVYGNGVEMNQTSGNIKVIIENPLIPLLTRKFDELGLNVKWITVKP